MTKAELKAKEAINLPAFQGIDLNHIKSKVTQILSLIGRESIFNEYTKHDISHINSVLESLDWIIPKETADKMTDGEWLMIVLSIYFHDLGMIVTKEEYDNRNKSNFPSFKEALLTSSNLELVSKINKMEKDEKEKFLYQEFVRHKHAERVKAWIAGNPSNLLGCSSGAIEEIGSMLSNLDQKFKKDLGIICESHHLDDLNDFSKYKTSYRYGNNPQEKVNLHYCAIILRTADLLHITSDRTPSTELRLINPSDPKSQVEWSKQRAVSAVAPKLQVNKEGDIDPSLPSHTIEVTAYFQGEDGAKGFFGLISYIGYANHELKKSYDWVKKASKQQGTHDYIFPWNDIDDSGIETEGFERKLFEFKLDQSKILQLLVGHTLYNDSTVVLRELIQNSIDAIRLQGYIQDKANDQSYKGKVEIKWNNKSRLLSFLDNGTGMTQEIIENHLLKVGSSRYQSEEFAKDFPGFTPISRFGIGILTCFMIADNIVIVTNSSNSDEVSAKKLTIKNVGGKYLLQHISQEESQQWVNSHGTFIQLEVRQDVKMDDLEKNIKKWILFPPCEMNLSIDNEESITIGYQSPAHAIESYLTDLGYEVDGKNIKVAQDTINDIDIAFGLSYSDKFNEWSFLTQTRQNSKLSSPVGTCIEGVRVEFDSPGYIGKNLVSVVNASGKHAPKTNVARSNIEANSERNEFLRNIYQLYLNHVENEIINIQKGTDFSLTWALNEAPILLAPIVRANDSDNTRPADKSVLFDELEKAKILLIEQSFERKIASINDVKALDHIWIIDCDLFRSAESLIKEIKSAPPLTSLVKTLYNGKDEKIKHIDNLLCSFRRIDSISEHALKGRTISHVKIFPVERRVDVCWSFKGEDNWILINSKAKKRRNYDDLDKRNYYLQIGDVEIDGKHDETFVEFFGNILILSGSPVHDFVLSVYNKLNLGVNDEDDAIMSLLVDVVGRFLHSGDVSKSNLEKWAKQLFDHYFAQNSTSITPEVFWKKIDKDAFTQVLVDNNWKTFSPASWKRDKSEYQYV
ncbi:HD domain-containing protein [Hymenobacter sublimis]|uniref:ATP-binding protein n=1 Tax=Hymenobacter sublimis TaxID=2933777 RepID=A0ABY4J9L4_9BACT|nr:ATP-binding protein [Hymenobacter sublimis]UPL48521.1 ATP-binding protein [Hymenobacter sublimis]